MTKLFLTGATGYVGGTVLHYITKAFPEIEITALVRDVEKGAQLSKAYSDVHIVYGDLDDSDVIEKAASEADVVVNLASTSHFASVKTIHRALASREKRAGYFVQISGATIVAQDEIKSGTFGEPSDRVFSDYPNLSAVKHEIEAHPNRQVDNYFLHLTEQTPQVRSAIVCAPIIYGEGEGPVHRRSVQIPELARVALERGRAVQVGRGLSRWGNVHIADVGKLFTLLVGQAIKGGEHDHGVWGTDGLYFAGAGEEMTFGEISENIAKAASEEGLIEDKPVESISGEEIDKLSPHASAILGTNAREDAQRARNVLKWSPRHNDLKGEILRAIKEEAKRVAE